MESIEQLLNDMLSGVEASEGPKPPHLAPPPTYSAVMRMKAAQLDSSAPGGGGNPPPPLENVVYEQVFRNRAAPPPYDGTEVIVQPPRDWSAFDLISRHSSEQMVVFGPDPTYIWCMRCRRIVVTTTYTQITRFTHVAAGVLCLIGCWPCCLIPYCKNSCKNTFHFCPECNYFFGVYRPW